MTQTFVWQFIFKTAVFSNISNLTVENIWHHVEDIVLAFFPCSSVWHLSTQTINLWFALQDLTLPLLRARISHRQGRTRPLKHSDLVMLDHLAGLDRKSSILSALTVSSLGLYALWWTGVNVSPTNQVAHSNKQAGWIFCSGSHKEKMFPSYNWQNAEIKQKHLRKKMRRSLSALWK